MNSLTKTLLFCFILSIVCNCVLSDDVNDQACINNVHTVFLASSLPYFNFSMAMGALSEYFFEQDTHLEDLHSYFSYRKSTVYLIGEPALLYKQEEVISYFQSLEDYNDYYREIYEGTSNTLKADLIGYFKALITNIEKIEGFFSSVEDSSPNGFCQENYSNHSTCKEALQIMFELKNDPEKDTKYKNLKGIDGLKLCYLKYGYLEITIERFYPELNSESLIVNAKDLDRKKLIIGIMMQYYSRIVYLSSQIFYFYNNTDPNSIFPTVEEYCTKLRKLAKMPMKENIQKNENPIMKMKENMEKNENPIMKMKENMEKNENPMMKMKEKMEQSENPMMKMREKMEQNENPMMKMKGKIEKNENPIMKMKEKLENTHIE